MFLVSANCFCTVVQPPIEGLGHVPWLLKNFKTYMVGPLVICVVFRDAPIQFLPDIERGDYIRISNFIKYRKILDVALQPIPVTCL